MDNITKARETSDGFALYSGTDTGPRGGVSTWYANGSTAGLQGRELWCSTQRSAIFNTGAASVHYSIR